MSIFSERLKLLRGASSQDEMARAVNMRQPQWARYETGKASPSIEILSAICRAHACSADWLLGIDERVNNAPVINRDIPDCSKCPFKRKLKRVEKALQDD